MQQLCAHKVAIVTGGARGIGRAHALELARQGASVVVNDLGTAADGSGQASEPALAVVKEIEALGGRAIANPADIADFEQARALVQQAIDEFGALHILVNNAGFLRDRMFVSTSEEEWDSVIRVHLKGHFAAARHAAEYWRNQSKAGTPVAGTIINTSSGAGLQGSVGQATYSAAKAGVAALTLVQAAELGRYGVTANAIAPAARTRMTEAVFADMMKKPESGFDSMAPENISPLVAWLASDAARNVTGRVFEVAGSEIKLSDGWRPTASIDKQAVLGVAGAWQASELSEPMRQLLAEGLPPIAPYGA